MCIAVYAGDTAGSIETVAQTIDKSSEEIEKINKENEKLIQEVNAKAPRLMYLNSIQKDINFLNTKEK